MNQQEKMDAIDRYFKNISPEEFNRICEEKYDIPRPSIDTDSHILERDEK